jgi:beta-galactosidase
MNSTPVASPASGPASLAAKLLALGAALALTACAHTDSAVAASPAAPAREKISFDSDWRFSKGDPDGIGDILSYPQLKDTLLANAGNTDYVVRANPAVNPGAEVAYVQPNFDDTSWRLLDLPHDWGIEGNFSMTLPGATGRLPWAGIAWYRKTFDAPAYYAGKQVFLDIDGAMAYASVWLNGHYLGGWPYGYSSFQVDLTPYLKPGASNTLAIRLDNPPRSSRWYPGGGIYRNVWLEVTNPMHVSHWGVYVTTPTITPDSATVNLNVKVDNQSAANANVSVSTEIFPEQLDVPTANLSPVGSAPAELALDANSTGSANLTLTLPQPRLWSLAHPNLYTAVTTVSQNGQVVDEVRTTFGVRTIKFDPDQGFFLNGEHVKIFGVCDHADLGPLGIVVSPRGLQRQLQILQEMGVNAIRTSHNMPAPELLDLCDRMGFLVMDESFDTWETAKSRNVNDYSRLFRDWHEKDLRAEVRRDRNHPSVILWSIGNEIPQQGSRRGNELAAELNAITHSEDPTRMTVTANNNVGFSGLPPDQYVYGFNYEPGNRVKYVAYHEAHPTVCLIGSETASCISSRGVYVFPVTDAKSGGAAPDHQMSSYDLYAPRWANPPDAEFAEQDKFPFVAGEFVWTGFDYIGEPTNNGARGTPDTSRSSYFGIVDLDGFKKDRFYLYQAHWRPDLPMAHILPHWNWPDRVGQVTPVFVYTSGDEAELFLNGQSLGRKKLDPYQYRLRLDDVVYAPGELKVVAYKNGQVWAQDTVKTTGPAAQVGLAPDRATIAADGHDLSFVTVSIQDKDGLTVPTANNPVHFDLTGPGEIVAVDNGDATSLAPIQGTSDGKAFNGLALVIIRAKPGQPGTLTLSATSDGLTPASVPITTTAPGM